MKNKIVFILGAGGVVSSIIIALKKMGASKIIISNRTKSKTEDLTIRGPQDPFTTGGVYGGEDGEEHLSFTQGAGHGGSHPHLVHEFLSALAEDRDPFPNAIQSANWTCTGIIAHESALAGGELKKMPEFALS